VVEYLNKGFFANLPLSLSVKEFWKSVNIWGNYGQEFSVLFFDSHCSLNGIGLCCSLQKNSFECFFYIVGLFFVVIVSEPSWSKQHPLFWRVWHFINTGWDQSFTCSVVFWNKWRKKTVDEPANAGSPGKVPLKCRWWWIFSLRNIAIDNDRIISL